MAMPEVETALQQLDGALKAAVDVSLQAMAAGSEERNNIYGLWEKYAGEWWGYLKQKSQEKGINPLEGLSYVRLRQMLNI